MQLCSSLHLRPIEREAHATSIGLDYHVEMVIERSCHVVIATKPMPRAMDDSSRIKEDVVCPLQGGAPMG